MFHVTEGHEPSAAAVKLALRVIANQAELPALVTSALWEEFNGRGPKSEMWWHGDMGQVAENFGYADRPAPTRPDDLPPVMRFTGLTIRESLYEYKKPIAELTFSAVFEEEHGVGILTDGNTILGTGYSCQASPYDLQARPGGATVEEAPQTTLTEKLEAYANEMGTMAEELKAMLAGKSEERRRWEELFPAPPPGVPVETDPSVIYGDWKLDPVETASVLTKLGEKTSVAKARKEWGNYLYRISRKILKTFQGNDLFDEQPFSECRRRGNRFDIVLHTDSIWEHWFDGNVLVDQCGLAYRRASS
jgi:hypothetical protein